MKKILLLLAACVPFFASADTMPVACPASIDMQSTVKAPPSWAAVDLADGRPLDRIGFYSGHPSEKASLVPDKYQDKAGASEDLWTFPADMSEQVWAACFYVGTTSVLTKQMQKGVRSCEVKYKTTKRSSVRIGLIEASCKT